MPASEHKGVSFRPVDVMKHVNRRFMATYCKNIGLAYLHKRAFWREFITSQRIHLPFDWKLSLFSDHRVLISYVF